MLSPSALELMEDTLREENSRILIYHFAFPHENCRKAGISIWKCGTTFLLYFNSSTNSFWAHSPDEKRKTPPGRIIKKTSSIFHPERASCSTLLREMSFDC
jgi:hypothetical protein